MTATDELRRLLDERGVEWWQSANTLGCVFTRWYSPLFGDEVCAMENGKEGLVLFDHYLTPEQAIAATLGDAPCLPYFWTHDGTLHIELPKLPESISVRLPEQRDREVYSARVWKYTLGTGTCEMEYVSDFMSWHCMACDQMDMAPRNPKPRYCKWCGRKVVDDG